MLYPHAAAHPPRPNRVLTCGGAVTRLSTLVPYRTRSAMAALGMAAVPAPANPPVGWPQCPEPGPGWRVCIHPQPSRAPRDEAMAMGPLRGQGPARAVTGGPMLQWGGVAVRQGAQPPRHGGSPLCRVLPGRRPEFPPSPPHPEGTLS